MCNIYNEIWHKNEEHFMTERYKFKLTVFETSLCKNLKIS